MNMIAMHRFRKGPLLGSFIAALALAVCTDGARAEEASRVVHVSSGATQHISLPLNKAAIIELDKDARDVLVSNPEIADAVVRAPRRVFLLALKTGQTNAIFSDAEGNAIATVEINVAPDVADLNATIARLMPDSQVKVESLNDSVVLNGTVANAQEAASIQDMAVRFTGASEKVLNLLKTSQREQVLIQVRVSEMQRSIAKQFGVDISSSLTAGGVPIVAATSNSFSLVGKALSDLSGVQIGNLDKGNNVQGILKALERVGLVHSLAEPNLTAISGESAKFLAGGEYPVPTSRDNTGNVVVTYKQYGVGLSFTPVVLAKGRISLQISTEVSQLTSEGSYVQEQSSSKDSNGNTVITQGLTVPALSVRRAETTVELPSGGSLVIGGLMQSQTKQNFDAFPGLKDLPVLGALFRSRDYQNDETELVVMVTAYLVDPVHPEQIATPGDGFAPASDAETILLGHINAVYGKNDKDAGQPPRGTVGYIVQ